ncbi:anaerobic ribonucleoside-triphosphate reductase activating protein [Jeotgalibaca sp. A122]|uniref:anaerobic ribonucleoside-triphosphate reductase activating protein n=2 Tax=unclassified Jeotgalibaca TaxID=2621505 RepID=UPI003FD282FA
MRNPKPGEWTSEIYSRGKIASYKPFNFVDGEGVRNSLYVSGCLFACEGCYNKVAQSFSYGEAYTEELEQRILSDLEHDYVQGLTLLGGEPFLNTGILLPLVKKVRERFGDRKDIWSWTGYTWEELQAETDDKQELLAMIDVLVDGRFELSKKDLTLQFRGSSNQRIIRVPETLARGEIVMWEVSKVRL